MNNTNVTCNNNATDEISLSLVNDCYKTRYLKKNIIKLYQTLLTRKNKNFINLVEQIEELKEEKEKELVLLVNLIIRKTVGACNEIKNSVDKISSYFYIVTSEKLSNFLNLDDFEKYLLSFFEQNFKIAIALNKKGNKLRAEREYLKALECYNSSLEMIANLRTFDNSDFINSIAFNKCIIYFLQNKKNELFLMLNYSFQLFNNSVKQENKNEDKNNYWGKKYYNKLFFLIEEGKRTETIAELYMQLDKIVEAKKQDTKMKFERDVLIENIIKMTTKDCLTTTSKANKYFKNYKRFLGKTFGNDDYSFIYKFIQNNEL
jgi:hypothetical protein